MVGWASEKVCKIFEHRNSPAIAGDRTTVPLATSSTDGVLEYELRNIAGKNYRQ
jgi:hypothetical protein